MCDLRNNWVVKNYIHIVLTNKVKNFLGWYSISRPIDLSNEILDLTKFRLTQHQIKKISRANELNWSLFTDLSRSFQFHEISWIYFEHSG